jgi:monofunctional glycosyltransferase
VPGKQSLEGNVSDLEPERAAVDAAAEQAFIQRPRPAHRPAGPQVPRLLPSIGIDPGPYPKPAAPVAPAPAPVVLTAPALLKSTPACLPQWSLPSVPPEPAAAAPLDSIQLLPVAPPTTARPITPWTEPAPEPAAVAPPPSAPVWTARPLQAPTRDVPRVTPPPVQAPGARPALARLATLWHWTAWALRYAAIGCALWFAAVLLAIGLFRFVDPPGSMLMLTKRLGGETLEQEWVPLDKVAIALRRAVVTSEDAKFCRHWGFDLGEIRAAMRSSEGFGRGASTITQQVSKNLFLWPGKSYVRKALEVPLTLAIETAWPKRRILEIYLNIAEWGPGIFGAQAASHYYFNKQAAGLTDREAALLAVSLPNPIARDASDPGPAIARRAATLQTRMRVAGISYCVLGNAPRVKAND